MRMTPAASQESEAGDPSSASLPAWGLGQTVAEHRSRVLGERMDLDDEPWPARLCGIGTALACFALIFSGSMVAWNRSVDEEIARSPDAQVCGNPGIAFFVMGLVGGVVGGAVVGTLVTKLVSWLMRGRVSQDSFDASLWEEDVPSAKVIANEAKRKSLRAEIGLVDGMIEQAEKEGDDEVLGRLVDYRGKLERDLGA